MLRAALAVAVLGSLLAACGTESNGGGKGTKVVTTKICPGPDAQAKALAALFEAGEGDTVEFCEGTFDFTTGLILHSKRGITIKGAGQNKTKLSFDNSDSAEGINVSYGDGITLQGLTVEDTPGNAIRIFKSNYVTIRDVAAGWSDRDAATPGHQVSPENGAYALYPVECRHVLIEDSYAYGSSDAGVYVGQSSDIVVRRTLAKYNVAGYEFENTYRAVFEDNVATENTGGFLVFDLPNLSQYGEKNIVRNNKSFNNNYENFAPIGNIVGVVPRGTGMLVLSTDQLEIYGNEIYDNDTIGLAIVNFGLVDKEYPDPRYDFFPEGIEIHDNIFRDNGGNPQEPNPERGEASALPMILKLKNGGRGAHIVWDGGVDAPSTCANYPKDADGIPLNEPNPSETGRYEARVDERGRPNYQRTDRDPECTDPDHVQNRKYNKWKFAPDTTAPRQPENWLCINHQPATSFQSTRPQTASVTPFLNAKFPTSVPEEVPGHLLTPASTDMAPHDCDLPSRVPDLRPLLLPFVPDPKSSAARPSAKEIARACKVQGDAVNVEALLEYNCPELAAYNLFTTPTDPRTGARGGVPFELNSALFSDYASKYRFLFLPPGTQATYQDHTSGASATLEFPTGTVIAKTFTFRIEDADGDLVSEDVVETRLLIKREVNGGPFWVGLPYIWEKDAQGNLTRAVLHVEGGTAEVTYDFLDPDPDVKNGEQRRRYTNTTPHAYGIPAALNCLTCHAGDNREPGAAPIGLKPRFMNRTNSALGGQNQLDYLKAQGLLTGMPGAASTVEKAPRWNVPGDSGRVSGSALDVHERTRAYLEVNCAHCHNGSGNASNSGLHLDAYRRVDVGYGICKKPVAAGRGSQGRLHDIVPGQSTSEPREGADASILYQRVASAEAGVRMPPVARTLVHGEAANLIAEWIDTALPDMIEADPDSVHDEEACTLTPPSGP